jgi:type IV pilus assembly protein PilM
MPEQTSVWKKLHLRRPRQAHKALPVANRPSSIWKRELHLTKRDKHTIEASAASHESPIPVWPPPELEPGWEIPKREELWVVPDPEPEVEELTVEPAVAPEPPVEQPEPIAVPAAEPIEVTQSVWKKEITLGRRPKAAAKDHAKTATKVVGLRIGSSQLAAALVSNNGSAELLRVARTPLQRGIVSAGEVRDPEALALALKQFFSKHKLPRRGVRLGVATNRIGVRVIEVPVLDDPKALGNAIRFRAHEVLPIPLADAVLDHALLDQIDGPDGERLHRVLLVFAHRELVDGYLDACKRAGVKLLGIDFDAFALLRALSGPSGEGTERRGALVAVAIGHERTIFAVSDGSVCDFARVLDWGGASLDAALVRALNVEPERAEQIRHMVTLAGEAGIGGPSPIELEVARAAIRSELQVLARELLSSLQFYQSRIGSLDIGEVLLTGGTAQLVGIDDELGKQLGVPVRIGDPLGGVTMHKLKRPMDAASLGIAVGLGIDG